MRQIQKVGIGICLKPFILYTTVNAAYTKAIVTFLCVRRFGGTFLRLIPVDVIKIICKFIPKDCAETWTTEDQRNDIIHGDSQILYRRYKELKSP